MEYAGLNEVLKNINASVVVYKVDNALNISMEYFNDRFAEIYGGDKALLQEELKKDITFGVDDEYKQLVRDMFFDVVTKGEKGEATYRATTRGNEEIWVNVKASSVKSGEDTLVYLTFFDITKQVRATQNARLSEQYLQSACEFANIFTWVLDIDTKRIHMGKLLQEQIGLPESMENFPECIFELHMVNPEYEDLYRAKIEALETGENKVEFEVKADLPDGMSHWIAYRFDIVEYANGRPKTAVGTAQFSDASKRLEARYRLEQKRKIVDDPSMRGLIISNINTNQVLERKNIHDMVPFNRDMENYEEGIEKFASSIISQEEREKWLRAHRASDIQDAFREGTTAVELEMNILCKDGIMRWMREVLNYVQHPDSGDILLYNYFYDNHDQRVFGELMNAIADYGYEICGSLVADLDQLSLIYAGNNSHRMIVGSYSELNSNYSRSISQEDQAMYQEMTSVQFIKKETAAKSGYELTYRTIEDGEIHYKKAQCYLYDRQNQTYLILRSDVTSTFKTEAEKRSKLEKALQEAEQANHAKNSFLSRMSHELRTPLNAINGYTTLIKESLVTGETAGKTMLSNIDATQRATGFLLDIISDILDIQSIEQGKTILHQDTIQIEPYMENIVDMIRHEADEKQIQFSYECHEFEDKYFQMDGSRVQQILLNILHNAVKFTPEGGAIQVNGDIIPQDGTDSMIKIVVKDTGIGMKQEFVDHELFQKFAQENRDITSPYDGCGTGLFLSNELIHLMDGNITCKSEKGKGSEFVITLMAKQIVKTPKVRKRRPKQVYDLSGIRILLCEDNPMNQDMEKRVLERMKCEVEIADDGEIGLQQFRESEEHYFDMILMDIRMPNMDGLEATREIRALHRDDVETIPILAVSANAFEDDVRKSLNAGMNEHLAKPVDGRILYQKIKEYCHIG